MPVIGPFRVLVSLFALVLLAPCLARAQASAASLVVQVRTASGEPVAGAAVTLSGPRAQKGTTDARGEIGFAALPAGAWRLRVEHLGYEPHEQALELAPGAGQERVRVVLGLRAVAVAGVDVRVAREIDEVRAQPLAVSAVDAREAAVQTLTAAQIVDRVAGVRVRQSGGLGSAATYSIHGLSGRQIRQFVDGVPAEFLGPAAAGGAASAAGLERIEVYKGVVPPDLGGDALGGAINLVTRRGAGTGMETSVGVGSFGAWHGAFSGRWEADGWRAGVSLAHDAARNDYPVDVAVPDEFGQPQPARVRRFHDAYRNTRLNLDLAVRERRFADELGIGFYVAGERDELQHNAVMAQPYGEAVAAQAYVGSLVRWSRSAAERWTASAQLGVGRTTGTFVDTTLNVYGWNGAVLRRRDYGGELSTAPSQLRLATDGWFARSGAALRLGALGEIRAHATGTGYRRGGTDPAAAGFYGFDPHQTPSSLSKGVLGISLGSEPLAGRLQSEVAAKLHLYRAEGWVVDRGRLVAAEPQRGSRGGVLVAARYDAGEALRLKASYEHATRVPDVHELLGDFVIVRPNPALRPERSDNLNASVEWRRPALAGSLGLFHRHTTDIVYLRTSQFFAQYQNLLKARARGAEATIAWRPADRVDLTASGTYQDLRNRSPAGQSSEVADRYFNARLPNVPTLFGNARARVRSEAPFGTGGALEAWWTVTAVEPFYLYWEVDGRRDSKATIPRQLLQSVGATYSVPTGRLRVNAEVQNLFDRPAYDVFSVQRPGRSLHLNVHVRTDSPARRRRRQRRPSRAGREALPEPHPTRTQSQS